MKNAIFALLGAISVSSVVNAASPTGAAFLNLNPSPRIASLGGAGSATAADVSSLYINPAGLSAVNTSQLMASHTQLFEENTFSAMAFGHAFGAEPSGQSLGISAAYLRYGAVQARRADKMDAGSFVPSDLAIGLSYARRLGLITGGLTVKAIQQKLDGGSAANGVAADLGTQWKTPVTGLQLGLAITNMGPPMKFVSEKYNLPAATRLGAGYTVGTIGFLSDVTVPVHGGETSFSLGTEFAPVSMLTLRAGYLMSGESRLSNNRSGTDPLARFAGISGGIGLRLGRTQFDFAMTPHQELGTTQQFSFTLNFR